MRRRRLITAAMLAWPAVAPAAGGALAVACAANLMPVFPAIAARFERHSGTAVKVTYGSSGVFTRQIAHGAPFDVFVAADTRYPQRLVAAGLARGEPRVYAAGRCVLLAHRGAAPARAVPPRQAAAELAARAGTRFAIPNPAHAPYGRAAEEILRHLGLWQSLQGRLVVGENAAQATRFVADGNAAAGIAPTSIAGTGAVRRQTEQWQLPADWHAPLQQALLVLKGAPSAAERFAEYMLGAEVGRLLTGAGYDPV